MAASGFDEFLSRREKAASAYVRGDGDKVDAIVPHAGAASFHSQAGGKDVAQRYLKDAKAFHDTSRFEILQKGDADGVGFWTGFQIARCQIGDMPKPVDMKIRVTEVFRKLDGEWKMVHRHADMPR